MTREEYVAKWGGQEAASPGWWAIDAKLDQIYGGREPNRHWASPMDQRVSFGGPEVIDGTSVYTRDDPRPHHHLIPYGLSDLYYSPDAAGGERSGWGYELSIRVPVEPGEGPDGPVWALNMMRNIANFAHSSQRVFMPGDWIRSDNPIRADYPTQLKGLLFVTDPELGVIDTPHGKVDFLQLVGILAEEHAALDAGRASSQQLMAALAAQDPLFVTQLNRTQPLV